MREVVRWPLATESELEHWSPFRVDRKLELDGAALTLAASTQYFTLTRQVDLHADEIDLIQLVLDQTLPGTQYWFRWAAPGEPISDERSIHIPPVTDDWQMRASFDLDSHPAWQGAIDRIEIGFGVPMDQLVRLRSLIGFAGPSDAPANDPQESTPRIVELGHEHRSAIKATPDKPINWTVQTPPGARLKFGYGLPGGGSTRVEVALVAVVGGEAPQTLFSESPTAGDRDRWIDVVIDLPESGRDPTELRFGITAHDLDSTGAPAGVLWANPEIQIPAQEAAPNLVLVVVDTLRADRLSLYGNSRTTSPHLDTWAANEAVVFERVVAAAPWTLPSHVSIFSGLDSHRHGANHDGPVPDSIPMLAEILRPAGYATLAVTGGGYLHPRFGLLRGFDRYRFWPGDVAEDTPDELEANMQSALNLIDEFQEQPFFLFFHTYEVHEPYLPRSPFYESFQGLESAPKVSLDHHLRSGVEEGFVTRRRLGVITESEPPSWQVLPSELAQLPFDLYDSSIAYTDRQLARLWSRLRVLSSSRPTLVVFTSDHGEMLGEHGLAGHASLYDETLLVPLVIALPDAQHAGTRVEKPVRSIDILPTILEVLDLPPPGEIDGVSLTPLLADSPEGETAGTEIAWSYAAKPNLGLTVRQGEDLKLFLNHTVWEPARGQARVFQISKDPHETQDLAAELPTETAALVRWATERLSRELPGVRIRMHNQGTVPVTGELSGTPLHPARIKSLDSPCPCVQWQAHGQLRFEIPAGITYTLILEEAPADRLAVRFDEPGSPEFQIQLDELTGVQSLTRSADGWRLVAGEPESDPVVVSFWSQGGLPQGELELDSELRDQLEALGYVH